MEAAGAPRSDAERRELVRRSTRGAGQRGLARRDKSELLLARRCRRAGRGTKHAPLGGLYAPACSGRWRSGLSIRPVLKHGPRSLTCTRAGGWQTHGGASNLTGGIPLVGCTIDRP